MKHIIPECEERAFALLDKMTLSFPSSSWKRQTKTAAFFLPMFLGRTFRISSDIQAFPPRPSTSPSPSPSASASSSNPFNHYPSNSMSSLESYDKASSSGLPGFPPQALTNQQYTPYHPDQALWSHYQSHGLSQPTTTRPPSPSIPPSLPLLHATNVSRPTSSSMDSAHLMTLLNFQTMSSPPKRHHQTWLPLLYLQLLL